MAQNQKNIATTVLELLTPTVTQLGYELWDVEYVKEGARYYLRITIDCEEGIGIEDCEKVHRTIDPILDEADPIENSYYLEVSSPGVERVLRKAEHYEKMQGEVILCKLFRPVAGSKTVKGVLAGLSEEGEHIAVLEEGKEEPTVIALDDIAKANVVFEF